MSDGHLLSANVDGQYILKLTGEVRVPLCRTLDECVDEICALGFKGLLVDFSAASNADSTTLGLIAKLCIRAKERSGIEALIYAPQEDMLRLLTSMGFDTIATIITELENPVTGQLEERAMCSCDTSEAIEHVLEAHKILMELSENNREKFSDLVEQLERDLNA